MPNGFIYTGGRPVYCHCHPFPDSQRRYVILQVFRYLTDLQEDQDAYYGAVPTYFDEVHVIYSRAQKSVGTRTGQQHQSASSKELSILYTHITTSK